MPKIKYVKWLLWGWWLDGITVPPLGIYIKLKFKDDARLKLHEQAHWAQYEEWGFWKFWYEVLADYTWRSFGRQDSDAIEVDADKRADENES